MSIYNSNSNSNVNGTGISTYHLTNNPELYEPSRNNTFEFIGPKFDQILAAGKSVDTAATEDYLSNFQEVIKLSVAETSIPHFDLDIVEVKRGNSTMKFAGTPTFNTGTLTCNDYVGARTKDMLLAWQALAYNVDADVVALAKNYKFDCTLVEYSPDYSEVVRKWILKGCWIKTLSESNFSHDSHDKRTIEATFVYDRAIPERPKIVAE